MRRACCGLGGLQQGGTDAVAFHQAIERHGLLLVAVDVKREQPDRHPIVYCREA
jgi:hypothetical protein